MYVMFSQCQATILSLTILMSIGDTDCEEVLNTLLTGGWIWRSGFLAELSPLQNTSVSQIPLNNENAVE